MIRSGRGRSGRVERLVVALVFVVVAAACRSGGGSEAVSNPGSPLSLVAAVADGLEVFEFSYRARGTDVLDCVLPNRGVSGTVFADGALAIIVETPAGSARALNLDGAAYLGADLFAPGSVDARWVRIERTVPAEARPALDRILGVDLAAYVAAPGPPPSGNEVLVTALDQADVDAELEPIRLPDGGAAAGYRLVVGGDDTVPVIDAWVDGDGFVVRTQVQDSLTGQPGTPNPDTGWVIDYRRLPMGVATPAPPKEDVIAGTASLLEDLAPPMRDRCELEIGPEPTRPRPQP